MRHQFINQNSPYILQRTGQLRTALVTVTMLIALAAATGCTSINDQLQTPTVKLINIQPQSLREGRTLMALTRLRVTNPNSVQIPITGGMVKMTLAGTQVAEGDLQQGFTLPANGYEEIDVRINLSLANSITLGMAMLEGETTLPYQLDGYVDIGIAYLGRVQLREAGEVSLNQLRPNYKSQ